MTRKHAMISLTLLASGALAGSQAPSALQPQGELAAGDAGQWRFEWHGVTGRSYFLQSSEDMVKWRYLPEIRMGADEVTGYDFQSAARTLFLRLRFTDQWTQDPFGDDFDNDGLSNWDEVSLYGTDPFNPDTDGDGLPDGWEVQHGFDPNDDGSVDVENGPDGDPDGDGLSNLDEFIHGTDPHNPDSDGDGISDGGEVDQGTDPNDPNDTPDAEWFVLTGNMQKDFKKTRRRLVTIPAGRQALVVVAVASDEFPDWTEDSSVFNDLLEWKINPEGAHEISGVLNVNESHDEWVDAVLHAVAIQGFLPASILTYHVYQAPADSEMQLPIELSATNIGDGALPSTVMAGVFPLTISQSNPSELDGEMDVEPGSAVWITGAPAMPDVRADFRGAPDAVTVGWRMEIRTELDELRGKLDDRNLPFNGYENLSGSRKWKMSEVLGGELVGGKCTLHFRINGDFEGSEWFQVRGRNPEDGDVRARIDTQVGTAFEPYAWAIAAYESRCGDHLYNQFNPSGVEALAGGQPRFGAPDGWGIAMIDRRAARLIPESDPPAYYPADHPGLGNEQITTTAEVWDWRDNITAMHAKLLDAQAAYQLQVGHFREAYSGQANWTEPPVSHQIGQTTLPAEAWALMVLYDGVDGVPVSVVPAGQETFQCPWIFDPETGTWSFHDNAGGYATQKVLAELEAGSVEGE